MKLKAIFLLVLVLAAVLIAEAGEKEKNLHRGRPARRGNEASQPVSQITVGEASYGGNGCPAGTMRAVFAPDSLSFSILFDQFVAEVENPALARRDVLACEAIIPVQLPEGVQMEITRVDLRGFAALPGQAKGMLNSVFNFRGRGGDGGRLKMKYHFEGPLMENYELSSDVLAPGDTERSPCGGAFQLRIENQLRVQAPRKGERASITLDSVDGAAEATYFVSYQSCQATQRQR